MAFVCEQCWAEFDRQRDLDAHAGSKRCFINQIKASMGEEFPSRGVEEQGNLKRRPAANFHFCNFRLGIDQTENKVFSALALRGINNVISDMDANSQLEVLVWTSTATLLTHILKFFVRTSGKSLC